MLNDPFGISVDAYRGWWRTSCSMSTLGLASIIQGCSSYTLYGYSIGVEDKKLDAGSITTGVSRKQTKDSKNKCYYGRWRESSSFGPGSARSNSYIMGCGGACCSCCC